LSETITCPKCGMTSHHPVDVRKKYCGNCQQFHAMFLDSEPIHYNAIRMAIEEKCKRMLGPGVPFELVDSNKWEEGCKHYQYYIKIGGSVWKATRRLHVTPTDALRELSEMMDAGL
jgi:hypothetical protein